MTMMNIEELDEANKFLSDMIHTANCHQEDDGAVPKVYFKQVIKDRTKKVLENMIELVNLMTMSMSIDASATQLLLKINASLYDAYFNAEDLEGNE